MSIRLGRKKMKLAKVIMIVLWSGLLGLSGSAFGTVYDFSTGAGVDHFAFGESLIQAFLPPATNDTPAIPVASTDYTAMATSDGQYYRTPVFEGGDVAAVRYVFTIAESPALITQIDISWEGGANEDGRVRVWAWNATTGSYSYIGQTSTKAPPGANIWRRFTTNASEFVASDNTLTLLAAYLEDGARLMTDYLSVTVTQTSACGGDAECDDGLYCNGTEWCDPVIGCQPGTPVVCDDGIACTADFCNEGTATCDATPDDAACQNGIFCDGTEVCDPDFDCQAGDPMNCDDGIACTTDSCNETTNSCDNIPDDPTCIDSSVWFVDTNATGANDGSSWLDAFNSIQDALAAAVYGDEIWVAAGTYKPDEGAGKTPGDYQATYQLRNGVALYGGFSGIETSRNQRDVALNETILSGDIGVVGYKLDNSYHVVTASGTDSSAVVDGFTVMAGYAPIAAFPISLGAGVYIGGGSPTLINCTFSTNEAGSGGGVSNNGGNPTLINCTFSNNIADIGGGMYNYSGSPTLINCVFSANQADEFGGGMAEMGGSSQLTNCLFIENVTVTNFGGGLYVWISASPTVTNCTFSRNQANYGGGVYNYFGSAKLVNTILWGNTATYAQTIESAQISGTTLSINYSCVQGWSGIYGGVGNTRGNPFFVDPIGGDYHLSAGSASIDAGDNNGVPASISTDIDGNSRFADDPATPDTGSGQAPIVDMGAYEFAASCLSDADCDDGEYCNGQETCSPSGFCLPGIPQDCIPQLTVNPLSLDFTLIPDQSDMTQITLTNGGTAPTDWDITLIQGQAASAARISELPFKGGAAVRKVEIDWNAPHEPNTLLVGFKALSGTNRQISSAIRGGIHTALGTTKLYSCKTISVDLVQVPAGADLQATAAKYAARPEIAYVEPNYIYHAILAPDDPDFNTLWGLHNTGQAGGTLDADIDAPEAWDLTTGSRNIIVAVIDTGIDYTHPDLAPNMWTNNAELNGTTGVDDDGNGIIDDIYGARWTTGTGAAFSGDPYDDHYHGTHVAGTIGATGNNNLGVVGVNWNVRLMALKFLNSSGRGYLSDVIPAIEYAVEKGAHLTSNSWGGGPYSQALKDAIEAAGAADQLFVAAAGNSSLNTDIYPMYPASYDSLTILSVAAMDRNNQRSLWGRWGSNWGNITVDLAAPGSEILSTSPGNSYRSLGGTSMATPHVSGVAALVLSRNATLSALDLKQKIMDSVDPVPAMEGLTVTGGRLNAAAAVSGVFWLSVAPMAGTINPGESVLINVSADATGLSDGFLDSGLISISSDDPTSPHEIPVSISVSVERCFDDTDCDDGLFCNGAEICDLTGVCLPGIPPDCDDGVGCTVDSCNETIGSCDNVPSDAACDNGLSCDGVETCNAVLDCQMGTPIDCDDGVACTVDSCNEGTDTCSNVPDHASCSNGIFCDGAEVCDSTLGCQAGTAPDCSGLTDQCNDGVCDDVAGACVAQPVPDGTGCDNGDSCAGDECQAGICIPMTCGPPPPAPPTRLKGGFDKKVELEWKPSPGPNLAGYNVYRSVNSGGPYTKIATLGPTKAYKDFPGPGSYCYVVTAINTSGGESDYSNEVCGNVVAKR